MQRATIALDDEFVAELDRVIAERGYQNRSEAIRDLARAGMRQAAEDSSVSGHCVAALVYVYDHESRELANLVEEEGVDVARRFDGASGHGEHVEADEPVHAGNADRG